RTESERSEKGGEREELQRKETDREWRTRKKKRPAGKGKAEPNKIAGKRGRTTGRDEWTHPTSTGAGYAEMKLMHLPPRDWPAHVPAHISDWPAHVPAHISRPILPLSRLQVCSGVGLHFLGPLPSPTQVTPPNPFLQFYAYQLIAVMSWL
ncbi:hypothetical protein AALO_G00175250, partial [Alosa alosa]